MDIIEDIKDCNVNGVFVEIDEYDVVKIKGKIGIRLNKRIINRLIILNFVYVMKCMFVLSD